MNPQDKTTLLWLQAGGCSGCTMALMDAEKGRLNETLAAHNIEVLWHPSLSEISGAGVIELLEDICADKVRLDILCLEGAVIQGPNGTGRFQMMSGTDRSLASWVGDLAQQARHVVAVGSCAAFGGISSSGLNETEATGLQYEGEAPGGFLGEGFRDQTGLPVINVAGCAPHPDWIMETVAGLAGAEFAPQDFDALARPAFFANHLAHHGCGRNEYYEYKASALGVSHKGCLMEYMGCKATQAVGDCNMRDWNGGGSCPQVGTTCISCTTPGFEHVEDFQATPKFSGIPVGLPTDMPKAWFIALAALSKSATPERVRTNARSDRIVVPPAREENS